MTIRGESSFKSKYPFGQKIVIFHLLWLKKKKKKHTHTHTQYSSHYNISGSGNKHFFWGGKGKAIFLRLVKITRFS